MYLWVGLLCCLGLKGPKMGGPAFYTRRFFHAFHGIETECPNSAPSCQRQTTPSSARSGELAATRSRADVRGSGAASLPECNGVDSAGSRISSQKKRTADEMSDADEPNLTRTETNLEDILLAGAKPHLTPSHHPVFAQRYLISITLVTLLACRYAPRSARPASGKGCKNPRLRLQGICDPRQAARSRRAHGWADVPRAHGRGEAFAGLSDFPQVWQDEKPAVVWGRM